MTATRNLIPTEILCTQYEIEFSFVDALHQIGLIRIEIVEQNRFIHQDQIADFEKMIRLHHELDVNPEGIDVIFNLLEKERALQMEINALKNRLRIYESD
jgi:phage terminase small subunit